MKQKITKKLVATLVATITAFTLLFMAQPAQASFNLKPISVVALGGGVYRIDATIPAGFDPGKCLRGAVEEVATFGVGTAIGMLGRIIQITVKAVAGPIGTLVGTAVDAVIGCIKKHLIPNECDVYDRTHAKTPGQRCHRR